MFTINPYVALSKTTKNNIGKAPLPIVRWQAGVVQQRHLITVKLRYTIIYVSSLGSWSKGHGFKYPVR